MSGNNLFRKAIRFVLNELIDWVVSALLILPLIGITIYVFGFLPEHGEGVWIAGVVAYIIFVPLFFINIGKLRDCFCVAVKSCFAKLIGKSPEKSQDSKNTENMPLQTQKPVGVRIVEYCIGGCMLLAYAVLTICVIMFLPKLQLHTLGTVGKVANIILAFVYILFAVLFLFHFGKWHSRVCTAFFGWMGTRKKM